MAKYISTDIINAAQWDPQNTADMREFLAPLSAKIKKCSLVVNVTPSALSQEDSLDIKAPSLVVDYSSGGTVTAKPTDYIVQQSTTKLKVVSATNFEKLYQLSPEADPSETPATPSEKSALNELLNAASVAAVTANVSVDGSEYLPTEKWAQTEDVDALKVAVFNAHIVSHDANATAADVSAAIEALTAAIEAYNTALQDGTKEETGGELTDEPSAPDKTTLTGAIAAATAVKVGATVSEDGSDVDSESTWVTEEDSNTLGAAIATAQAVADDEDATQDEINQAVTDLQSAVTTFGEAAQAGTKVDDPQLSANKTALSTTIAAAKTIIADAIVSVDGSGVDATEQWVPQSAADALEDAIQSAESVANDPDATDEDALDALETLNEALATFGSAKLDGTKPGQGPNKSALITAINDAVSAKIDVTVSTNGYDVAIDTQWVTSDDMDALDEVLAVAEETRDDAGAIQVLIDSAAEDLVEAIAVFNAAKKNGMYTGIAEGEVEPDWDD